MPGSQDLKNTEASISDRSKGEAWGACPPPPRHPFILTKLIFLETGRPSFLRIWVTFPPYLKVWIRHCI